MPFNYSTEQSGEIVFKRGGVGCAQVALFIFGIVFSLVGLGLIILGSIEMPFALVKFLFAFIGLFCLWFAFYMPVMRRRQIPDKIIFNNRDGRVEVLQEASILKHAYIYYPEIKGFKIRVKSESSGSGSSSRTRYSYNIYLEKKDGGEWELLSYPQRATAEENMTRLYSLIDLNAAPRIEKVNALDITKLNIQKTHAHFIIDWKNSLGMKPLVLLGILAFLVPIFVIMFSSFGGGGAAAVPGIIIGSIVGGGFAIAIGLFVRKLIRDATTTYRLTITRNELVYAELRKSGEERKRTSLALRDVDSISYSFDTNKNLSKVAVYTKETAQKRAQIGDSFSFEGLKNMFSLYKELLTLDMSDLAPVDLLAVENLLQQEISDKGNVSVG